MPQTDWLQLKLDMTLTPNVVTTAKLRCCRFVLGKRRYQRRHHLDFGRHRFGFWELSPMPPIGTRFTCELTLQADIMDNLTVVSTPAPEPCAMAILGSGLLGLLAYAWRKRRKN